MNIFRLCGDMLHLLSILLLLFKLHRSKSCVGISARMQEMYLITFLMRYMDLFWSFVSLYNTLMKLVFIGSTAYLVYLMHRKPPIKNTYDRTQDCFQYEKYLLGPCILLGLICAEDYSISEITWSASIWIESVAIVPQLFLLQQQQEVENLTGDFVGCMGLYRVFYILNWIYRYTSEGYINYVGWVGGLIQTGLYCDFFYYYARSKWYGKQLVLPMPAV